MKKRRDEDEDSSDHQHDVSGSNDDDDDDEEEEEDDDDDEEEEEDDDDDSSGVGLGRPDVDDPQELERIAREQWVDRGYDEADFTVDKMYEIWAKEEEEALGRARGLNNLDKKNALLKARMEAELFRPDAWKKMAKSKFADIKKQASEMFEETKSNLTPAFLKRRRKMREYEERAQRRLEQAKRDYEKRLLAKMQREEQKRLEREDAERRKEKLEQEAQFKAFERKQKEHALEMDRKRLSEEIIARREQEAKDQLEFDQKQRAGREERETKRLREERNARIARWEKQLKMGKKDSAIYSKQLQEKRAEEKKKVEQAFQQETEQHEQVSQMESDFEPEVSANTGHGLFRLPIGKDEYYGVHEPTEPAYGLHSTTQDKEYVRLFSSEDLDTEVPLMEAKLMETESKVVKLAQELQGKVNDQLNVESEICLLKEEIDLIHTNIAQIDQEQQEFQAALLKPPRRDPTLVEIETQDHRTRQKFDLLERLGRPDLVHGLSEKPEQLLPRLRRAEKATEKVVADIDSLKQELENAKKQAQQQREDYEARLEERPELPMIVGRSLGTVETMENQPGAEPDRNLKTVVTRTNAELLKHAAKQLEQYQRDLKMISQKQWSMTEDNVVARGELELAKTRLAQAESRFRNHCKERLRSDLVIALETFFQNGGKNNLLPSNVEFHGVLDWWNYRLVEGCSPTVVLHDRDFDPNQLAHLSNEQIAATNGLAAVKLEAKSNSGHIEGVIDLPKYKLWRVRFNILRFDANRSSYDESDFINVKVGPSVDALKLIGKYANAPSRKKAFRHKKEVRHCIDTLFAGSSIAYRFEFNSSGNNCLIVENGWFTEEQIPPVEVVNPEYNQVITDFSRLMRVEMNQGRHKASYMLEELIQAKDSKSRYWDSTLLQGTRQRFRREEYIRIMEKELQKVIEAKRLAHEKRAAKRAALMKISTQEQSNPLLAAKTRGNDTSSNNKDMERHRKVMQNRLRNKNKTILEKEMKEKLLDEKMLKAKERYINRKRQGFDKETAVKHGEALVGKKVEVFFDDIGRWRVGKVLEMRTDWVDSSTRLRISHRVKYSDNKIPGESPEGDWEELLLRRFVFLKTDVASVEERRRVLEEKQTRIDAERNRVLEEQLELERQELQEIEENAAREKASLLSEAKKSIKAVRERARSEAEFVFDNNKELKGLILAKIKKDLSMEGIDAKGMGVSIKKTAEHFAKEDFVDKSMNLAEEEIKEKWQHEMRCLKERHRIIREQYDTKLKERKENAAKELEQRRREAKQRLEMQKQELSKTLALVDIDRARPHLERCPHRRVRFWGTQYKNGVRCLACHKELSKSYLDPSQAWETNQDIGYAVSRHRRDEARFQPLSTEELHQVLSVRLMVEKEEREIELRDRILLKNVLPTNLSKFNDRHIIGNSHKNNNSNDTVPETTVDAAHHEPLSFMYDTETLAAYQPTRFRHLQRCALREDYLTHFSRVRNFRIKLSQLEKEKERYQKQRREITTDLEFGHRDCLQLENRVEQVQREHERAENELQKRRDVVKLVEEREKALDTALDQRASAELKHDAALNQLYKLESALDIKMEIADQAMLQHDKITNDCRHVEKHLQETLEALTKAKEELNDAVEHLRLVRFQQRDTPVFVPPFANKLGLARIKFCRPGDEEKGFVDLVKVQLILGNAKNFYFNRKKGGFMIADMYMPLQGLIDAEKQREQHELDLMKLEDHESHEFSKSTKLLAAHHSRLMEEAEEEQREWEREESEFVAENRAVEQARVLAMANAVAILKLKWKRKQFKRMAKQRVHREHHKLKTDLEEWKKAGGTYKAGGAMPEPYNAIKRSRLRKKYFHELCLKFEDEQGDLAEQEVRTRYQALKNHNLQVQAIERIIKEMIRSEIKHVTKEYFQNSLETAQRKMDDTGIFILRKSPCEELQESMSSDLTLSSGKSLGTNDIHFEVYNQLARSRRLERIRLEKMLANWAHHHELERRRLEEQAAWEARREEREREEAERDLMEIEDFTMKKFCHEERQRQLSERWAMAEEENHMRAFLKFEEMKMVRSKYNVVDGEVEEKSDKALRRDEIKKIVADRQRAARERMLMALEDDLGNQMRMEYMRRVQELLLKQEMGILGDDDADRADMNQTVDDVAAQMFARAQERELEKQRRKLEEEKRKFENRVNEAFLTNLKAEIKVLTLEEQLNKWVVLDERNRQLSLRSEVFSKSKLHNKLRMQREVGVFTTKAKKAGDQVEKMLKLVDFARPELRKAQRKKAVVMRDTEYMISDVIHDSAQRFQTEKLFADLHQHFFYLLSQQIANNAEVVSLERSLRSVMDKLERVVRHISLKEADLVKLKLQWRRRNLLLLRRSELGKHLFGKYQLEVLKKAFNAWGEITRWQGNMRDGFRVKMGVRKLEMDIDAIDKSISNNNHDAEHELDNDAKKKKQTLMQRHINRHVKCKHCHQKYMESANHGQACLFHPGVYHVACPKTCTVNIGAPNGSVDTKCAAHYRKRWSCCDQTKAVPFGLDGCSRRWHVPMETDDNYEELSNKIQEAVQEQEKRNQQLGQFVQKFRGFVKSKHFDQLETVREKRRQDREIAASYDGFFQE